ncbi:Holliday junction resolvase RuvX [Patescibacteria group bacterium]|nr:Holliday junction resolvase RuvX [Patescibacteria group bacterium]
MTQASVSILGLDIGKMRIGVAKAYWPHGVPAPLTALNNDHNLVDALKRLIAEENVAFIVAGYPRSLNSNETAQTAFTQDVVDRLRQTLPVQIKLQDEAVTSIKAESELKSKGRPFSKSDIDSLSAVYILEDFLSEHQGKV